MTSKYRKKPVVIEAIQWTGDNYAELAEWLSNHGAALFNGTLGSLTIPTREGDMRADPKDWIIKGVKGEFYPCKPDIFDATYELVVNEAAAAPPQDHALSELRVGLNHAARLLCETRSHAGSRPCSFCYGQIVAPYSVENLAARGAASAPSPPEELARRLLRDAKQLPPEAQRVLYDNLNDLYVGPSAPTPELKDIKELNPEALRLAVHAYWKDNGDARHNLATAILAYLNAS